MPRPGRCLRHPEARGARPGAGAGAFPACCSMSPRPGLSATSADDLARFILRIKHELALPMIWIEHDMQMVADLADRIHVLDYGRTLASGPPAQVLNDPAVVAAYLGAPR